MPPPTSFLLYNGLSIPAIGLGTFQGDPSPPPGTAKRAVLEALKIGYRHIDTALRYDDGNAEREVGEAVRESGLPREEIFITTKLENVFHASEDVEVGLDMSLKNLGMEYVDLYLMHFPYAYKKVGDFGTARREHNKPVIDIELSRDFDVTWAAMEKLLDTGKVKSIGVSNLSTLKLKRLLQTAQVKPTVHQIEVHPHFPNKSLVRFCQENDIHIAAFGPLGCVPLPFLAGRAKDAPGPLGDETIAAVARKYGRSPAQVSLTWLLQRGLSVVPKSFDPGRIAENFDCQFELTDEDFEVLDNLVGESGERAVRNLDLRDYLGFDNFNEETEEP